MPALEPSFPSPPSSPCSAGSSWWSCPAIAREAADRHHHPAHAVAHLPGLHLPALRDAPGGFGSLADVKLLFGKDELLLAGWVHYLAFDLFIGAWRARFAAARHPPPGDGALLPDDVHAGSHRAAVYFAIRTAKTKALDVRRRDRGTARARPAPVLDRRAHAARPGRRHAAVDQRPAADPRINPWIKPMKFLISITIFVWSIAWFMPETERTAAPRARALDRAAPCASRSR